MANPRHSSVNLIEGGMKLNFPFGSVPPEGEVVLEMKMSEEDPTKPNVKVEEGKPNKVLLSNGDIFTYATSAQLEGLKFKGGKYLKVNVLSKESVDKLEETEAPKF